MNDFTKEELKQLSAILQGGYEGAYPLYLKIQSMIDSYCEHKFGVVFIDGSAHPRCKKCNVILKAKE